MAIYVYESKSGERVEREYPMAKSPKTVRVDGKRYERVIAQVASPVVANVSGVHGGPPGSKVQIRNKRDIAEIEARCPGLKYNPDFYHEHDPRNGK